MNGYPLSKSRVIVTLQDNHPYTLAEYARVEGLSYQAIVDDYGIMKIAGTQVASPRTTQYVKDWEYN